jgi:hypothetical protein
MPLAGIEPVGFRVKNDLRNHRAIVQPRLYDCSMVTQLEITQIACEGARMIEPMQPDPVDAVGRLSTAEQLAACTSRRVWRARVHTRRRVGGGGGLRARSPHDNWSRTRGLSWCRSPDKRKPVGESGFLNLSEGSNWNGRNSVRGFLGAREYHIDVNLIH